VNDTTDTSGGITDILSGKPINFNITLDTNSLIKLGLVLVLVIVIGVTYFKLVNRKTN
jgi:hypothetical protein